MAAAILAAIARTRSLTSSSNGSYLLSAKYPSSYSSYYCCYDYVQVLYLSTKTLDKQPSKSKITTPPLVFTEDFFVSKYQFSPQIASKLASASARMRKPQNADLFLSFLQQSGFSNAHLERVVKHHTKLLSLCPEKNVKPKFKIFHDLGLSADEVSEIIGRHLNILSYQPTRIIRSLDVYRRLLGSNEHVIKLIKKHASMLYADPEKTIEFLKECGVQMDQINSLICTFPAFFLKSPQSMKRCVDKVDEMGVDRTSNLFIYAVRAVSSMSNETLKLKLKNFQDLGFSEHDVLRMFRSAPGVIAVSTRKIKEVTEVLLGTGKYDMSCILKYPVSLKISVEKRYKPRLEVLKVLEKKSLISKWPRLWALYNTSNKTFFEKFVASNINEVGEAFIAKTAASGQTVTGLKNRD